VAYLNPSKIMKHTQLVITFMAIAALAAGCKPSEEEKPKTAAEQLDKVKNETKEAAQAMKDYAFTQKEEFAATMKFQLAEINKNLDLLDAKIEKAADAAKAEAKPKIQALRDQANQLSKQLDEVKNASESAWDSVKIAARKAIDSLKGGFQQSRQWVSDKIAP